MKRARSSMRVALGNDHAGFGLRRHVLDHLESLGVRTTDVGTRSDRPVDFPLITEEVAALILGGKADRGILVCGTGAGACIAANKFPGIRAAVCHDTYVANQAVEHDDVNVLCIGAWIIGPRIAESVVRTFLDARFGKGADVRRRVRQLSDIEKRSAPPLRR